MSFASFVTDLSDSINKGIRAFANSDTVSNVSSKVFRTGLDAGKKVGNAAFTVGVGGINKVLGGANFIKDNREAIGNMAKRVGKGALLEANEFTQAGFGAIQKFDDWFLTEAPLDRSIIRRKFNKRGLALMAVGMTAMQGGRDVKEYVDNRQGSNDGQLYTPTTRMSTPYTLSEQMAYSQHGRSFADNAGATGDLVFALNNMRHG